MTSPASAGRVLRFGNFRLDMRSGDLHRDGSPIKLPPQPAKVLALLAGRAGELVTRDEIRKALWNEDTFVDFDQNINFCIKRIREVLGDDAERPRYVQTVPRRGYRFAAEIQSDSRKARAEEASPYPGLATFTETDAEFFFGREEEIDALWRKLHRRSLLAVIGPSGAGKSSFLRAGLAASRPEGWRVVICEPGDNPFLTLTRSVAAELAEQSVSAPRILLKDEGAEASLRALRQWREQHREVLLCVDQFEELFTLNDENTQARFAELLGRAVKEAGMHVLLSLRDDFLMHCRDHPALQAVFSELTPLKSPQGPALRRALVEPARKCGYEFEDEALVTEILTEVSRERGALPLLAFAASRLWEKRDRERGLLTREAYLAIAGVGGALAQHAELTLHGIASEHQPMVRETFRNLVTARGTHAPRDKDEVLSLFSDKEAAARVLDKLIEARLLTSFEQPTTDGEPPRERIEIIHESLLSSWPRLVRWQAQDAEGAVLRDQLHQAAELWEERGRPTDLLWTGTAVREYQLWRDRYSGRLTEREEAFAAAMVAHAGRRKRRLRLATAAVFVAVLGFSIVIARTARIAIAEARRAESSKLRALGQLELERDPTAAAAYALKSLELSDSLEARLFALRALQQGPVALIAPVESPALLQAQRLAFSPDGDWLAVAGSERVQVWREDGRPPPWLSESLPGKQSVFVAFDPSLDQMLTSKGGEVRWWSIPDGKEQDRRKLADARGLYPGLPLKGSRFFALTYTETELLVHSWPLGGQEPTLLGKMEHGTAFEGMDIDPSGTWLAYGSDRAVYLRSLNDWNATPRRIGEHPGRVRDLKFHPSGNLIAASSINGDSPGAIAPGASEIRLWSTTAGTTEPVRVLDGKGLTGLTFDPSGSRLSASATRQSRFLARVWGFRGPADAEPLELRHFEDAILFHYDAAFDPTGQWLATTHGHTVRFWPLDRAYPRVLGGHSGRVYDVKFTPDGRGLVSSGGDDKTVRRWSLDGEAAGPDDVIYPGQLLLPRLALHPSDEAVLVTGNSGQVFRVSFDDGATTELLGFDSQSRLLPIAVSANGRLAAAAPYVSSSDEKVIRVWDLESRELVHVLGPPEEAGEGFEGSYRGLAFTPGGELLSISVGGFLRRWSLEDGVSEVLDQWVESSLIGPRLAVSRDGHHVMYFRPQASESTLTVWLTHLDLENGRKRRISSHGTRLTALALDPTRPRVVTGDSDGVVRVGPMSGEAPHVFYGHEGMVLAVDVSPDGRWIASASADGTIRLWPMPIPEEQPFQTLPYEEILRRLGSVTNLRMVEDEESTTGYRQELGPFPGWQTLPRW